MSQSPSYAGDVDPKQAWDALSQHPQAQLIDVRTEAEWAYVGLPDVSPLQRQVLLCEWQSFPDLSLNPAFVADASAALAAAGHAKGEPIFFLCRSGARSRSAAIAMTQAGYGPCFNVREGFEGALDQEHHRGRRAGWKADGLPWMQS
jgi:rhodanese-related sulfurtransferase